MPPIKKKKKSNTKKTSKPKSLFEYPKKIVIYSPSGYGKTSLAAQFGRTGFLCDSQEDGITFLCQRDLVPKPVFIDTSFDPNKSGEFSRLVKTINGQVVNNLIDTLVVESVTGIETSCFVEYKETKWRKKDEAFYSYWAGPKEAARFLWPEIITALQNVMISGKNVIVTAHTRVKEETDPEGTKVMKYKPYSEDDTWARLHRWASNVFFISKRIVEDTEKVGLKSVAKDINQRLLYVDGTPYCDAKNWDGLTGVIQMGNSPEEAFQHYLKALER